MPRASIYQKGTGLDSKKYNMEKSEEAQLLAYYQNYLNDDKLSEEEKEEIRLKAEKIMLKHADIQAQ